MILCEKIDLKFKKVNYRVKIWTSTSYRLHIYNENVKKLHVINYKTEYIQIFNSSWFFLIELE